MIIPAISTPLKAKAVTIIPDISNPRPIKAIDLLNETSKRYAAKEALSKALGTGIRKGINFKNIEISNNKFGKPSIKLSGSTANFLKKKIKNKKYSIYLSLSDDEPWAQATVIISYN